jgi:hypothetical protein
MSAPAVWLYFNMTRYMQSPGRTSPITGIIGRYDELLQLVRLIYCCTKRWQELNGEAATVPLNLNSIWKLLEAWLWMSLSHAYFSVLCLSTLYADGVEAGSIYIYMLQVMNIQRCGSNWTDLGSKQRAGYICTLRGKQQGVFPMVLWDTVSWA